MPTNDFLSYFNKELSYLKSHGEVFSKLHPKVAGKLGLSDGATQDPHILRLIQSFAFLSARIHRKLDDDFSQIAQALLSVLYPQYLLPIPALSIVKFHSDPDTSTQVFIAKNTYLETNNKPHCQFKTCYDLPLYPIEINKTLFSDKLDGLQISSTPISSSLTLGLKCLKKGETFAALGPQRLSFYINLPSPYCFYSHEMIMQSTVQVSFSNPTTHETLFSSPDCIQQRGFNEDDGLLPYPPNALLSYRLLTEFFVFPEKFMFFDIELPDLARFGDELNITFYLKDFMEELQGVFSTKSFVLGCTPIVNLFEQMAEPILLDYSKTDYLITPNARRTEYLDIYSIQNVRVISHTNGEARSCYPIYGLKHHEDEQPDEELIFWQASRQDVMGNKNDEQEVFLSFVDLDLNPCHDDEKSVEVDLLCTNHSTPYTLPFGNEETKLQLLKEKAISSIVCLLPFTPPYRFPVSTGLCWQLISQLSLNNFFLIENKNNIREILNLYNISQSESNKLLIDSIQSITSTFEMRRQKGLGYNSFAGGTKIVMKMEGDAPNMFLFSMVLNNFFSSYCSINSFTELSVMYKNAQRKGEWRWPQKNGCKEQF